MRKKALAFLLSFVMMIFLFPSQALALTDNEDGSYSFNSVGVYSSDYAASGDGYTKSSQLLSYIKTQCDWPETVTFEANSDGSITIPRLSGSGVSYTSAGYAQVKALNETGYWVCTSIMFYVADSASSSYSDLSRLTVGTVDENGDFVISADQVSSAANNNATAYQNFYYVFNFIESDTSQEVTYSVVNATEGVTEYARMEEQWAEDYNNGNTGSGYISHYVPSVTSANAGSKLTVANWGDGYEFGTTNGMIQLFDGRSAFFMTHSNGTGSGVVWIYQGYKYSTDGGTTWSDLVSVYEETGETVTYNGYTWPEYELVSTTIDVPEDSTGVCIAYQFTAASTTNFIYELRDSRLVYQDDVLLGASVYEDTDEGTWDTYNVSSTEGITVEYTPTMNMENLGSDVFTYFSWDVLQAYETSITDDTRIYLHFFFDTDYIDLANSDFSGAYLESDMFDLVDEESTGETAIELVKDEEGNYTGEVLVTCQWDSESADAIYASEGTLDPMIYFKGFALAVTGDWGEDVTSITIFNDGYVDGIVDMDSNFIFGAGKFAIWGGYEDDTFILQLAGKVTEPSLDKTIVTDTGSADQDDVAAGEDVDYKLTSTIPDTLKDHITYSVGEDGSAVGTVNSTIDEETGETVYDTYYLTFHDAMNSALKLNENSIVVAINGTELSSDYYTVTVSASDGCTFEVSVELLALYTADIIDETYFGTATITVAYTATLSEDATAGTYTNTAWVTYDGTNSKADEVEVDTYGIQVFKYDQDGAVYAEDGTTVTSATGLGGAVFTLTYPDGTTKEYTTDENGYISLDGLDAGTYTLVETKAPDGYVASGDTIVVTVDADNTTANVAYVYVANAAIPSTGGAGTTMYTVAGMCIILIAGAALVVTRRKRREE